MIDSQGVDAAEVTYHDARTAALFREMDDNPDIFLIGGVVTLPGVNPETPVADRFPDRVIWTSIAEFSSMSIGTGAAMAGMRPFVPLGTASFMFYGWPALTLEAPNVRYVTGGQVQAPVVFHSLTGLQRGSGVDHEHSPQAMLQQIPGLRIYAPGTPAEVDGVFHAALTGGDPTLIVDHKGLASCTGTVPATPLDVDRPYMIREGRDVAVITYSAPVQLALEAANRLEEQGLSVAVISTPLLNPAPIKELLALVADHLYVVFVDESREAGSIVSYLASELLMKRSDLLVDLVCTRNAPSPGSKHLADAIVVSTERIVASITRLVALGRDEPTVGER